MPNTLDSVSYQGPSKASALEAPRKPELSGLSAAFCSRGRFGHRSDLSVRPQLGRGRTAFKTFQITRDMSMRTTVRSNAVGPPGEPGRPDPLARDHSDMPSLHDDKVNERTAVRRTTAARPFSLQGMILNQIQLPLSRSCDVVGHHLVEPGPRRVATQSKQTVRRNQSEGLVEPDGIEPTT